MNDANVTDVEHNDGENTAVITVDEALVANDTITIGAFVNAANGSDTLTSVTYELGANGTFAKQ